MPDSNTPISRTLRHTETVSARLSLYAPGFVQSRHSHGESQVSILLAGEVYERSGDSDVSINTSWLGYKPAGTEHSNAFGANGALILTFLLHEGAPALNAAAQWMWRPLPDAGPRELLAGIVDQGGDLLDYAVQGLIRKAVCGDPPGTDVPDWLMFVHDALLANPHGARISDLARRAGVHRVHLCRSFQRYFGVAPSAFRNKAMTSRALCMALCEGGGFAAAAHEAGFADQSHLSRAVKTMTGFTLGQLRRLFH